MTTPSQVLLAVFCLLAAIGAHLLTPHQLLADLDPVNLEQMVPLQFGDWHTLPQNDDGVASPVQEAFIKSIYSQVLSRVYADNAGHRIMLSIAYTRDQSDNSGTQSHKPEICYPAQGFQIVSNQKGSLALGNFLLPVRHLVAVQGARIEPISYWTMVGYQPSVTDLVTKLHQLEYGLRDVIPDGLIFRVSSLGADAQVEYQLQNHFIKTLGTVLSSASKSRITGQ
jgi:EpsI family protein